MMSILLVENGHSVARNFSYLRGQNDVIVVKPYSYEKYPAPKDFDAIIVTCAPDHVPQPLTRQLKDGGRMVIPVGPPGYYQTLWLVEREGEQFLSTNLGSVSFVPLLGEH